MSSNDCKMVSISEAELKRISVDLLKRHSVPKQDAVIVADVLVDANLRGVDSHGVRLLPIYLERIQKKSINPKPTIRALTDSTAVCCLDGDNGLGQLVAQRAMSICIKKAGETGVAAVACRNSSHFGAAAYFANMASEQGMVGFATTNGTPAVAPWGSKEPLFGANPFAVSIPADGEDPITLDMATTKAARAKIRIAAKRRERIPGDWALDRDGVVTSDAAAALEGSLLPIGGYKGYGLALVLEVLSGIVSGAQFGRNTKDLYAKAYEAQGIGHFFLSIDRGAFLDLLDYQESLSELVRQIKTSELAPNSSEILLPGEIESRTKRERLAHGIALPVELYNSLTG